ncbi:MAG: hypothetical protein ACJAZN_001049 [Planctomycetota bacterium]|jgi:hypothetical protein
MSTKQYGRWNLTGGTTKRWHAAVTAKWLWRNVLHNCSASLGRVRTRHWAYVEIATPLPNRASSSLIHGAPHVTLSLDRRMMSTRTASGIGDWAGYDRDLLRQ